MKKALLALSVAAGMVGIAHADGNTTTLYGGIGFSTTFSDSKTYDLETEGSKFGIQGTEDLGNGLQAVYKLEFNFNSDDNLEKHGDGVFGTRYAYVGLKGDFGQVLLGKQNNLYKGGVNYNDIFNNVFMGKNMSFTSKVGGSRIAKMISYTSPKFNGFQFAVGGALDGSGDVFKDGDKNSFRAAQAQVIYDLNGFHAGVAYAWKNQPSKVARELVGGSIGYSNDTFQIGFGAEHAAKVGEVYNIAGQYAVGDNTFRAGLGMSNPKADKNVYGYALGWQYDLSKRTYTWVEGEYTDYNTSGKDNDWLINVGLHHNF